MDSEAMSIARGRLIKASPWLAPIFTRLQSGEKPGLPCPGTDGTRFLHDPEWLHSHLREGSIALAHATLHCLLGHLTRHGLRSLEADMEVALLMDELLPDFLPVRGSELFAQARHRLKGVPLERVPGAMSEDPFFQERRGALAELLAVDDHSLWTPDSALARLGASTGEGWTRLRRGTLNRLSARRAGRTPGATAIRYRAGGDVNRSYRALLSRYAENREEAREGPDTFDRNLYSYGLETYGNLPIIEPAETRERRHIDELAIVIDTSGSCLETLTARFLDETRALLADKSLFAERFNLRILQCDAKVQRDDSITNLRDFERYIENLQILGGGGTDFRPAFNRIDRLIGRGAFRRLGAVLFFSDGMGLFPPSPPEYDVIFAFFRGEYDDIDVPPWARKLVLEDGL